MMTNRNRESQKTKDAEFEGSDVIAVDPWAPINELQKYSDPKEYSAAICQCPTNLYIKTPAIKTWHTIKCPRCGFIVNLFCGLEGDKMGTDELRGLQMESDRLKRYA